MPLAYGFAAGVKTGGRRLRPDGEQRRAQQAGGDAEGREDEAAIACAPLAAPGFTRDAAVLHRHDPRSANSTIRLSCVTITSSAPREQLRSTNSRMRRPGLSIERRGGLVQDQQVGLAGDRPGDRHSLLLAAAQLQRRDSARSRSPTTSRCRPPRQRIRPRAALQDQRDGDVLRRRERRKQVVVLEHEADRVLSRNSASASSPRLQMSRPSTITVPSSGRRMPESMLSSVVLPLPDGPMM